MLASQGPVVSVSGGLKLWWGRLAWRRPKATRANLQPNFRERLGLPRSACPSKAGRAYALPAEDPDPRITAMSPRQSHRQKVFTQVNEATKWAVTAAVALVLLWRHDVHSMWSVVGCVASSFICKVLLVPSAPLSQFDAIVIPHAPFHPLSASPFVKICSNHSHLSLHAPVCKMRLHVPSFVQTCQDLHVMSLEAFRRAAGMT